MNHNIYILLFYFTNGRKRKQNLSHHLTLT